MAALHPFAFLDELTPPPRLVCNAAYLREARLLARSERFSRQRLDDLALERLRETCVRAYAASPYYTRVFDEAGVDPARLTTPDDLRRLPTMGKEDLRSNLADIVSRDVAASRREYVTTGGSTGVPVGLYLERGVTYPRTYAYERRQYAWGGVGLVERRARLRGLAFEGWRKTSFNNLYLSVFHLTPATAPDYVDALLEFRPTYVEAYPSAARFLAEWLLARPAPPRFEGLKAVFLSSENVSPADSDRIAAAFGAPVKEKYGNSEQATIIGQCEHGTMHEFEEYSFTEYLPAAGAPEDGAREIVSTTFVNRATPLIRYRTEDLAVPSDAACPCGRSLRTVTRILGREQDFLLGRDGERVTIAALNTHTGAFDGIARFQYVQDEPGRAVVRVVPLGHLGEDRVAAVLAEARNRSGGTIDFSIEVAEELETTPQGKNRFIVRRGDISTKDAR